MLRPLAALALLAPAALAGCLGNAPQDVVASGLGAVGGLLASPEPLWNNPQTAPHPVFRYATLTQPAVGANVSAWWAPIPAKPLPAKIAGLEHVVGAKEEGVLTGGGMSVFGSLAVVPGYSNPTYVIDIRNPEAPKLLSTLGEDQRHRNVDFIAYPDGRLVAVLSTGKGVLNVWDLTDPTAPVELSEMKPTAGTHKVNVVPGTPIVYNANSDGGGNFFLQARTPDAGKGITEIFDLTDPANPVHVQDWKNGFGCHHIYFWISEAEEKYRALCAGIEFTQIWDIADPRNPSVIVNVPVHHGNPNVPSTTLSLASFSHFSILNAAGNVLIVGDEAGGGGVPPGCDVHAQAMGRGASGYLGSIWFYDVSDEKAPKLKGWFSPTFPIAENPPSVNPAAGPGGLVGSAFMSCTAHHGRLVPDPEGRDMLAMAFYRAGVYLVDFSDPSNPLEVDHFNDKSNTWEVQYYNGYLFTGDLARGMDVLSFK